MDLVAFIELVFGALARKEFKEIFRANGTGP